MKRLSPVRPIRRDTCILPSRHHWYAFRFLIIIGLLLAVGATESEGLRFRTRPARPSRASQRLRTQRLSNASTPAFGTVWLADELDWQTANLDELAEASRVASAAGSAVVAVRADAAPFVVRQFATPPDFDQRIPDIQPGRSTPARAPPLATPDSRIEPRPAGMALHLSVIAGSPTWPATLR